MNTDINHLEATIAIKARRERVQSLIDSIGRDLYPTIVGINRFESGVNEPGVSCCWSDFTLVDDGMGSLVTLSVDVILTVRGREADEVMSRIDGTLKATLARLRSLAEESGALAAMELSGMWDQGAMVGVRGAVGDL